MLALIEEGKKPDSIYRKKSPVLPSTIPIANDAPSLKTVTVFNVL